MIIETSKKNFEHFKKECKKWIDIFELNNWSVHYSTLKNTGSYGACFANISAYMVTLSFCEKWEDNVFKLTKENISHIALHEVLHLLLARVVEYGDSRYVTESELIEAGEELVNKLTHFLEK